MKSFQHVEKAEYWININFRFYDVLLHKNNTNCCSILNILKKPICELTFSSHFKHAWSSRFSKYIKRFWACFWHTVSQCAFTFLFFMPSSRQVCWSRLWQFFGLGRVWRRQLFLCSKPVTIAGARESILSVYRPFHSPLPATSLVSGP